MKMLHIDESEKRPESSQLVDQMDTAIGNASTSIGMIMSELVRRSLRGGVGEIGTSIHGYAQEQVSSAVEEVMPEIKRTVEVIAESTSVRITSGATEKFGEELKSLESRTSEQTQIFAARIKAESDSAFESIHRVVGESRDTTEKTAQDLRELHQRAKDSWKKVQLELQSAAEARLNLKQQIDVSLEQNSQSTEQIKDLQQRFQIQSDSHSVTKQQLATTTAQLENAQKQLNATQQELAQTLKDVSRAQHELQDSKRALVSLQLALKETATDLTTLQQLSHTTSASMASRFAGLEKRLEEIERPKGIRALFSKFSGGKKKPADDKHDGSENLNE